MQHAPWPVPASSPRLRALAAALVLACTAARVEAVEFKVVHEFDFTQGGQPSGGVAIGPHRSLYGATLLGGSDRMGVLFMLSHAGGFRVLHDFHGGADGAYSNGGVMVDAQSNVFGTTSDGGAAGVGTLFQWNPHEGYRRLFAMSPVGGGGAHPRAAPVEAPGGLLYGTTLAGGDAACNCGTVYRYDTGAQALQTLHAFDAEHGSTPVAPLALVDGTLYGTLSDGGPLGGGSPFTLGIDGSAFNPIATPDRGAFTSGLAPDAAGGWWGVTEGGGTYGAGAIYRIDAAGVYTSVYAFQGKDDGGGPTGTLLVGRDGFIYGTAQGGGRHVRGTVFRFDPATGTLLTLHAFNGLDGAYPAAGVVQDDEGALYGTTPYGGKLGEGTVFRVRP